MGTLAPRGATSFTSVPAACRASFRVTRIQLQRRPPSMDPDVPNWESLPGPSFAAGHLVMPIGSDLVRVDGSIVRLKDGIAGRLFRLNCPNFPISRLDDGRWQVDLITGDRVLVRPSQFYSVSIGQWAAQQREFDMNPHSFRKRMIRKPLRAVAL